jgi:hypothetical protein
VLLEECARLLGTADKLVAAKGKMQANCKVIETNFQCAFFSHFGKGIWETQV